MDITKYNIDEYIDDIASKIKSCVFVALDAEFSGLLTNHFTKNSLFDSAGERYNKVRKNIEGIIATQIGLSTFHFDRERNEYKSATYTFHLCPQVIGFITQLCTFQADALNFLTNHNFDFNKIMYEGISYLNLHEEEKLKNFIENRILEVYLSLEDSRKALSCGSKITEWLTSAKEGSTMSIPGTPVLCYLMAESISKDFPSLQVDYDGRQVTVTKLAANSDIPVSDNKDTLIKSVLGFSRIVKILKENKKPLVLHNALSDLLIFTNQFEEPLPCRYDSFKNTVHDMFPIVYDTKYMSLEIKSSLKKDEFCDTTALDGLYNYFINPKGRYFTIHSPSVSMFDEFDSTPRFHQAGWDSFCTGYCFVKMCHYAASKRNGCARPFTSTEHMYAVENFCNCIYLCRAAQPHMCLHSCDPPQHRPEYLYVETLDNNKINLSQVMNTFSQFGSVDVKQYGKKCALVAVPSKICARKILYEFKQNDWRIAKYNTLKHSHIARMALWSGVLVSSGSLFALILHKIMS